MRIERKKRRKFTPPGPGKVAVGLPAGAVSAETLAAAVHNHFGTADIPARPFITSAMRDNRLKYRQMMIELAGPVLRGEMTSDEATARIARVAVDDIQAAIDKASPANAAGTIRQKGRNDPLDESGDLRGSINWRRT